MDCSCQPINLSTVLIREAVFIYVFEENEESLTSFARFKTTEAVCPDCGTSPSTINQPFF